MILVAGSLEELKCQICFILASQGISIRTLILNDPDGAWIERLKNYGATLAVGDLRDPNFLPDLYLGINAVICSPIFLSAGKPGDIHPGQLDLIGMHNLINAAKAAEVLRFVYLSFSEKNADGFAQEELKQAIEQGIIESGVPFTILQVNDCRTLAIGSSNQSNRQARIKELARLATQMMRDPAQVNAVVQSGSPAVDPENSVAIEGTTFSTL